MRIHLNIFRVFSPAILATVFLLSSSGCGKSEKVVAVAGTVTHNGQPVPGLIISFVPVEQTQTGVSTGQTDEGGKYSLKVAKTGSSGAVVGYHKVWVSLPRAAYVEPTNKEEVAKLKKLNQKPASTTPKPPADIADILKKYGNPDVSTLVIGVNGGEQVDIKLD
jgi:hypothetical protein